MIDQAIPPAPGVSADDIPLRLAYEAHRNTSHVPDKRAAQEQAGYVGQMQADWSYLLGATGADLATLIPEFHRYREGYASKKVACLFAAAKTASPIITGPANFPTARNRKRCETEMRRVTELIDFRQRALRAIVRKLRPDDGGPVKSNDPEAVKKLAAQLAAAEQQQARYKRINAAHRAYLADPASLDTASLSAEDKKAVREYKPKYSWEPHPVPPYRLTNNNANIRRIEARIAELKRMKASPRTEVAYTDGIKVVEDPDIARVQIVFPGQPDAKVRARLKSSGFRWAPSAGAWQRHLNHAGRAAAVTALESIHVRRLDEQPEPVAEPPADAEVPGLLVELTEDVPEDAE